MSNRESKVRRKSVIKRNLRCIKSASKRKNTVRLRRLRILNLLSRSKIRSSRRLIWMLRPSTSSGNGTGSKSKERRLLRKERARKVAREVKRRRSETNLKNY